MEFEFDPAKGASNKEKHGIDFVEAQALFADPNAIESLTTYEAEERWFVTGKIGEKHWTAVITYRTDKVRIISVRRSRNYEVEKYEQQA